LAAKDTVADGYDSIKIDFVTYDKNGRLLTTEDTIRLVKRHFLEMVEKRIAVAREVVGPTVDIIIECH